MEREISEGEYGNFTNWSTGLSTGVRRDTQQSSSRSRAAGIFRNLRSEDHSYSTSQFADMNSYRHDDTRDHVQGMHSDRSRDFLSPGSSFDSSQPSEFSTESWTPDLSHKDEWDERGHTSNGMEIGFSPMSSGDTTRSASSMSTLHDLSSSSSFDYSPRYSKSLSLNNHLDDHVSHLQGHASDHRADNYLDNSRLEDELFHRNTIPVHSKQHHGVGRVHTQHHLSADRQRWDEYSSGLMDSDEYSRYCPAVVHENSHRHSQTRRAPPVHIQQVHHRTSGLSASARGYMPSHSPQVDPRYYRTTNQPRMRSHASSGVDTQRFIVQQQQQQARSTYHQNAYELTSYGRPHTRPSSSQFRTLRSVTGPPATQQSPPAFSRSLGPSTSRVLPSDTSRDFELEHSICHHAQAILAETSTHSLKSVELANSLRDRIGKDALVRAKALYGGLLVLLELYGDTFAVRRIPKNDQVDLLVAPSPPLPPQSPIISPRALTGSPNRATPHHAPNPIISHQAPQPPNPRIESRCLRMSDIPEDVSYSQLYTDFGGEDVVEKVSIDYQGSKRTGLVWFKSANGARAALQSPMLAKWKDVLSLAPEGCVPPLPVVRDIQDTRHPSATSVSTTIQNAMMGSVQGPRNNNHETNSRSEIDVPSTVPGITQLVESENTQRDVSPPPGLTQDTSSPKGDDCASVDDPIVPSLSSLKLRDESGVASDVESAQSGSQLSSRGTFRRAAPAPIITAVQDGGCKESEPSPSGYVSSPLSTPGGTPHLAFTFFDDSSAEGFTTLPRETLPQAAHDVMITLCDQLYVPQRFWEKNEIGDYLFCQAIIEILNTHFGGNPALISKLKQQLRRKFGGNIRTVPLKALVQAYPNYFEVDCNVSTVRPLISQLPYMNISVVTDIDG